MTRMTRTLVYTILMMVSKLTNHEEYVLIIDAESTIITLSDWYHEFAPSAGLVP